MKALLRLSFFLFSLGVSAFFTADLVHSATAEDVIKKIRALPAPRRKSVLEEGAKKEGQAVIYTSMSLSEYPMVMGAFEKAYPFVKTNAFRSTPSGVFRRADTEFKAGRYAVDVIMSAAVEMWNLKQGQLSTHYVSPEGNAYPSGAIDSGGYWSAYEVTPIVLAFNTKMVPPHEVPLSYEALLDPKWKGKMNLGTDEYAWLHVMLQHMGKEKGLDYMRALAKQQLHMPGSSSVMRAQLTLAGESAIAIAARGRRITEFKEKGAPIDFRILDPYAAEPSLLAMMRRSPNPHAGILFYDWLLTADAQAMISDLTGRISIRKGIKRHPRIQELFQKDFVFVQPSALGSGLKETMELYHQIFGLHRPK
ncbi:MAG: ABC transporter substrate-binding protein [Candidatus Binatia bacterium]